MKPRTLAAKLAAYPVSRLLTRQEAQSLFDWLRAKGASNPKGGVLVLQGSMKRLSFTFVAQGATKAHVRAEELEYLRPVAEPAVQPESPPKPATAPKKKRAPRKKATI